MHAGLSFCTTSRPLSKPRLRTLICTLQSHPTALGCFHALGISPEPWPQQQTLQDIASMSSPD